MSTLPTSEPVSVEVRPAAPNDEWDRFVASQPHGDITQSSLWAATKDGIGQQCRLVLGRGGDGSVAGGALMVQARVAPALHLAYVPRGPVVRAGDEALFGVLAQAVVADARANRCRLLIVQPPGSTDSDDAQLTRLGFAPGSPAVAPEATVRLDVTRPDAELLAEMSTMRRRNIRKIVRNPIAIEESTDVELFHRLHVASAARQGFEPRSLAYLEAQWRVLHPGGNVVILVARVGEVPVAALWLTVFGSTTTYRLPGWEESASGASNVNEALHWAAVNLARDRGCTTYDFGGFDRPMAEHLLAGGAVDDDFRRSASYFKLGFASEPAILPVSRWLVPGRLSRPVASPIVARLLTSDRGRRLANRLRNG